MSVIPFTFDAFCDRCGRAIRAHNHIGTLCTGCGPKTVAGTGSNRNNKRGIRGVRGVEFETAGRCANTVNPGLTTTHLMTQTGVADDG